MRDTVLSLGFWHQDIPAYCMSLTIAFTIFTYFVLHFSLPFNHETESLSKNSHK